MKSEAWRGSEEELFNPEGGWWVLEAETLTIFKYLDEYLNP